MTTFHASASATLGVTLPQPGSALGVGNVIGSAKLAEKTIELTVSAQFGHQFGTDMVWFGLTQAQERQHGFDTATNLGGRAFILQFKVSSTVPKSGMYFGQRRFGCQHHQMSALVNTFGGMPNSCFYFLPNLGLFSELVAINGDILGHSFLMDVAGLQNPVPPTHRKSGYHYAYLDSTVPVVTVTSTPFKARKVIRSNDFVRQMKLSQYDGWPRSRDLLGLARRLNGENARLADLFYKNSALVVLPAID
jgi:hypothetical protein